ncbi:MAG TPA: hypothetical protein VM076_19545 [Gemmatimonadaceae bacterium]|nr:hypothetical protein [Gemmatimonadaceae bacterium]
MRPSTPTLSILRSAAAAVAVFLLGALPLAGQSRVKTPSAVLSSPNGRSIGSVHPGVELRVLETRGAYAKVSVDGFVERARLTAPRGGATRVGGQSAVLRAKGASAAKSVASLDAGTTIALSDATPTKAWVRVTRDGWVLRSALERPASVLAAKPKPPTPRAVAAKPAPSTRKSSGGEVAPSAAAAATAPITSKAAPPRPATSAISALASDSTLSPAANVALRSAPDARALATIAPGAALVPLARERGWVRVRLEGWVPERDVVPADTMVRTGVSAADLRADPVASRGKVVRWSVQILATQKADALRRDLAADETYLLARGPYEENALLYLVVPPALIATTKGIPELSQAMITARVRTGRSDLVGVPILDILTITPKK